MASCSMSLAMSFAWRVSKRNGEYTHKQLERVQTHVLRVTKPLTFSASNACSGLMVDSWGDSHHFEVIQYKATTIKSADRGASILRQIVIEHTKIKIHSLGVKHQKRLRFFSVMLFGCRHTKQNPAQREGTRDEERKRDMHEGGRGRERHTETRW